MPLGGKQPLKADMTIVSTGLTGGLIWALAASQVS